MKEVDHNPKRVPPTVSFILPLRLLDSKRVRNLSIVIKNLMHLNVAKEIIIVEMDNIEKLKHVEGVTKIFIKDSNIFNRSKARNIGAKHASSNILAFFDIDLLVDAKDILACIRYLKAGYGAISPWSQMYDLTEDEFAEFETANGSLSDNENYSSNFLDVFFSSKATFRDKKRSLASGCLFMTKTCFYEVGGWPMDLTGWGAEDDIFSYLIHRTTKYHMLNSSAIHIPHARHSYDSNTHKHYQSNLEHMNHVFGMSDSDLVDYIIEARRSLLKLSTVENLLSCDDECQFMESGVQLKLNADEWII